MSKRSKFIIILLLALTAAVIIYALFGMEHNVDTCLLYTSTSPLGMRASMASNQLLSFI